MSDRFAPGFEVRVRPDVRRLDEDLLVGGSPLRLARLSPAALGLLRDDRLVVEDARTAALAGRLVDGNLADPVLDDVLVEPSDLTVVIPVRDRPAQLARALASLPGLRCLVVDDASDDPAAVASVALAAGAEVLPLTVNVGPAGARNSGLRRVGTPYVAFVDSDVQVDTATLLRLARHLADHQVALVGPLVRSRSHSARPRWFERFDERDSSLALGSRGCSVRPGAHVAWLPSACLVGRVDRLGDGFTEYMRVGEDVDLVWRLVEAGEVVRYDPSELAHHDTRTTVRSWLGRKYFYGTGGAQLAAQHGDKVAPAVLTPTMAIAGAAVLVRRRWSAPVAALGLAVATRSLLRALPETPSRPALSVRLAAQGLGWAIRQESALLLRHWWPLTLLGLRSRLVRRAVVTSLLVDMVAARIDDPQAPIAPMSRRLDDLAYGAGLWAGAVRAGSPRCLLPRSPRRRLP